MKDKDKNRDPERARKRAKSDLRCAVRKLWPDQLGKAKREAFDIDGYDESDRDYVARNMELCVAFLEAIA